MRILRIAIPVAVVVGLTIISLITYFNPLRVIAKLPINLADLVVNGTKITMEKPHLSGFTKDARAPMHELCDLVLAVPCEETALIQQIHITANGRGATCHRAKHVQTSNGWSLSERS